MIQELLRGWRRWAAHNRVRVTILLGLLYVTFSVPLTDRLLAGAVFIVFGQAIRFWAAGYLEKNVRLARGGPYRLVRHPLYVGSFFMGLGLAVSVEHIAWWMLAYLLLFVGFFIPAIHVEELRLQSIFGPEYQDLMVEVPGVVPRFSRRPPRSAPVETHPFSWLRVVGNREIRSAGAMLALIALQSAKIWLA